MRSLLRRAGIGAVLSTLLAVGACQELLAPAATDDPAPTTGTVTFWTSDASPSPIAVRVNGTNVGTLTLYRTSAPACGAASTGGTLTVTLQAGTHTVSAYETQDTGTWPASSINVRAGQCMTFEFLP